MSEVSEAMETQPNDYQNDVNQDAPDFEPVCVDVDRIYDSCGAKDCLRDLTVFFTAEDQELVESATAARITKASVLTSTVNVDSVAFHRGYYSVDAVFYFAVFVELYTSSKSLPTTVTGLAVYSKRAVLYGSDANVKSFTSEDEALPIDPADFNLCAAETGVLPKAEVQVSFPMVLSSGLSPVTVPEILPFVPENVTEFFGGDITAPATQKVTTTLGIFSIIQLSRSVQLNIPSYDFCVPRKECEDKTDDPCEAFNKIEFPSDFFFPPSTTDDDQETAKFNCNCN